jgi:hypothetical protein
MPATLTGFSCFAASLCVRVTGYFLQQTATAYPYLLTIICPSHSTLYNLCSWNTVVKQPNMPSIFSYKLTNSMEQSPSWEINSRSAGQELIHILYILKPHCRSARARHWSPSWVRCIQCTYYQPISLISILKLSILRTNLFPLPCVLHALLKLARYQKLLFCSDIWELGRKLPFL